MNDYNIFGLLQFAGGTFPTGSFSQSWGLETYVEKGYVNNRDTLKEFIKVYLRAVFAGSEGPLVNGSFVAMENDDIDELGRIEEISKASKLTRESRESSLRMGNAFMRLSCSVNKFQLIGLRDYFKDEGITYPVAYGAVMASLKIQVSEVVKAYAFNSVNALVQSAVKLVPLGNTEAQEIITELYDDMAEAAGTALKTPVDEIVTFCPGLDIAGMHHENLAVRLYMT